MKLKYFFFLCLSFLILNSSFLIGTVRYVSKTGTSTPPYTSWATAADSIQKCINICSFGDTIFVANGVYKERIDMIPGLSLIGSGMDSCFIDTRDLVDTINFYSIEFADSCLLKGFRIDVYFNSSKARAIKIGENNSGIVTQNKILSCGVGLIVNNVDTSQHPFLNIYNNQFYNVQIGLNLFNSDAIIRKNIISTDPNSQGTVITGILIGGYFYNNSPIIDSNFIFANSGSYGILKSYGAEPIISNNTIMLNYGDAMSLSYSETIKVFNNIILDNGSGIHNVAVQYLQVFDNYIGADVGSGIVAGPSDTLKNNIITNAEIAVEKRYNEAPPVVKHNNLWHNSTNYFGFEADTSNLYVDPMVMNNDTTRGELDFHLQMYSPLIDAGDPNTFDKDGSRSDIGPYGGPYGERYNYIDLAPRAPINLTAIVDSNYITLNWNRNTEADTSFYNVYRDTVINFQIDSTKLVSSSSDTLFVQINPHNVSKNVYKVTCIDKQGNESQPSEEVVVNITSVSVDEYPMSVSDNRLYQNYPNPFNPSTTISYRLKERGYVKLYVYDIKGELVSVPVNKTQEAGFYQVDFSSSSIQHQESGIQNLASGIYIYQIHIIGENNIPVFNDIKKMIYLK